MTATKDNLTYTFSSGESKMVTHTRAQELAIALIRTDGGTQPRAELNYDMIRDYAQDMMQEAAFPPIIVFYDGSDYWLADGFHRYHAAKQICREAIEAEVRQGTRRDAILYSVGANATHGLRRTNADKRRAVETLLNDPEWAKWSDREIARRCGVYHQMVSTLRAGLSLDDSSSERTYTTKHGTVATMNTANIGQTQPAPPPLISEYVEPTRPTYIPPTYTPSYAPPTYYTPPSMTPSYPVEEDIDEEEDEYPEIMEDEPHTEEVPVQRRGVPAALQTSESNEWYTPAQYVEAARLLMGGIDIDPASNAYVNEKVIQATTYYDIETNGLDKAWAGRIWLNPPYGLTGGESNQELWSRRLIEQLQSGVTEAVLLVNANTEAKWFQPLYDYPVCLTNHRIRFYNTSGDSSQPTQGNAFIYFGPKHKLPDFISIFSRFGTIVLSTQFLQKLGDMYHVL